MLAQAATTKPSPTKVRTSQTAQLIARATQASPEIAMTLANLRSLAFS